MLAEVENFDHQTPTECLHSQNFFILDITHLINLTSGLDHGIGLEAAEELNLFSSGHIVIKQYIVDQRLLDLLTHVVGRVCQT